LFGAIVPQDRWENLFVDEWDVEQSAHMLKIGSENNVVA
jgi:hypothetical protein